jgi:predicted nucleic acid-binding protein
MLVAIDTNLLVYAEGINGTPKQDVARAILGRLVPESTLLPLQVLEELFNVLIGKGRRSRAAARSAVQEWGDTFPLIETSSSALLLAMDLAADHQLGWWDAVVLSAAADASCRLLLSEDLQDGFTWSGVTVTNPFAATRHPLLDAMLTGRR